VDTGRYWVFVLESACASFGLNSGKEVVQLWPITPDRVTPKMHKEMEINMTDWRKPHFRRKGERDGKFDWRAFWNGIICLVILAVISYGFFTTGRYYEKVQLRGGADYAAIWGEYEASRVTGH